MDTNEKPPLSEPLAEPFWTPKIIFLVVLNVVFLLLIAIGLFLVAASYQPVLSAWLERALGL